VFLARTEVSKEHNTAKPLQEALFPVLPKVHPRCEPKGLRVFHPEDGGDMFLRNFDSYKSHMASSHPRRQHLNCSRRANIKSYKREWNVYKEKTTCIKREVDGNVIDKPITNSLFLIIFIKN
jgi:hypothetical protein